MDKKSNSIGRWPWQFSLKGMFLAVAFLGLACAAAKFAVSRAPGEDANPSTIHVLSVLSIPILLGGSIGALRERVMRWIIYGFLIDLAVVVGSQFLVPPFHH